MQENTFDIPDIIVIVLALIITLGIGVYYAFTGNKTTSDYLTGNRQLHVFPVTVSIAASLSSSVLVLGYPAETYNFGGMFWLYSIGTLIGAITTCLVLVPVFHPLQLTSVNQYLYLRYKSTFVAIIGTLASIVLMILYTGVVYFGPATTLNANTGFSVWASILICGLFTCIYTSIGGIRAVIWTDVFQAFLMLTCLLAICIQAMHSVGGAGRVWEICQATDRVNFNEFSADPKIRFTFWSLSLGVGLLDLNRFGIQQPAVQRYCSVSSVAKSRLTIVLALPLVLCWAALACLTGIALFAYYELLGCDPLRGGLINNSNQIVPYFVLNDLHLPGFSGLLFAGLIGASLSTASSNINAGAANLWDDVLGRIWPNLTERRNLLTTKFLVVLCGLLAMGVTFIVAAVKGTLAQMIITFMSALGGPVTAMFFMGIFFPFVNWIGAGSAGIFGLIFSFWIGFGAYSINRQRQYLPSTITNCSIPLTNISSMHMIPITTTMMPLSTITTAAGSGNNLPQTLVDFYSVSYLWIGLFSFLLSMAIGVLVSLVTGCSRGETVDLKLIHPLSRRIFKMGEKVDDMDNVIDHEQKTYKNSHTIGREDNMDQKRRFSNPTRNPDVVISTKL